MFELKNTINTNIVIAQFYFELVTIYFELAKRIDVVIVVVCSIDQFTGNSNKSTDRLRDKMSDSV